VGSQVQEGYSLGAKDENPYVERSDAFEKGMQLFKAGKLHEAALAFEAAIHEEFSHSEAWRMLGTCHAENDMDKAAIQCFGAFMWWALPCSRLTLPGVAWVTSTEQAVKEDAYNLDALTALGVSYVNELDYDKALASLQSWVTHNPKFHGLKVDADDAYGAPDSKLDGVMHLMLKATAWDPSDADAQVCDPLTCSCALVWSQQRRMESHDVHTPVQGLTVRRVCRRAHAPRSLWECCTTSPATLTPPSRHFRPRCGRVQMTTPCGTRFDVRVMMVPPFVGSCLVGWYSGGAWLTAARVFSVQLGATRANSSRSAEAVPAYRRALELKPTYARGWLNLGISHANLGHYADAAKAYIAALKLNPKAEHIWTYLRIALTCIRRGDLVELTHREDISIFDSAAWDL